MRKCSVFEQSDSTIGKNINELFKNAGIKHEWLTVFHIIFDKNINGSLDPPTLYSTRTVTVSAATDLQCTKLALPFCSWFWKQKHLHGCKFSGVCLKFSFSWQITPCFTIELCRKMVSITVSGCFLQFAPVHLVKETN